jgi:hypothetical protein
MADQDEIIRKIQIREDDSDKRSYEFVRDEITNWVTQSTRPSSASYITEAEAVFYVGNLTPRYFKLLNEYLSTLLSKDIAFAFYNDDKTICITMTRVLAFMKALWKERGREFASYKEREVKFAKMMLPMNRDVAGVLLEKESKKIAESASLDSRAIEEIRQMMISMAAVMNGQVESVDELRKLVEDFLARSEKK